MSERAVEIRETTPGAIVRVWVADHEHVLYRCAAGIQIKLATTYYDQAEFEDASAVLIEVANRLREGRDPVTGEER